MQEGPTPGQRTELNLQARSVLIGRDPASNLVVDDVEVSRRHARLIAQSGGHAIEDLGSTNGTFVNDARIKDIVTLTSGSTIRLGDHISFTYEAVPADEAGATGTPVKQIETSTTPRYMRLPRLTGPLPPVPTAGITGELPAIETKTEQEPPPRPASARRRPRRGGIRLPLFTQRWMMIAAVLVILGACAAIFFFWYVDANYLWCDVFGNLIPACP
jgi:pSer/pThr/pTyr-binding forkhead associated (FHA) protein